MRRAYSYIRFSSAKQAAGDSLRRQVEGTERVCQRHNWVLDDSLNLRDLGVSAFRGSNVREGALAAFLEAVKTGRVRPGSVLIVESLDRLSRNQVRPALQLFMGILDAGVSIYTFSPEREYTPEDHDPLTLIEPLFTFARAHEESHTKSTRVRAAWDQKRERAAQQPMTGKCPAWLKLTEKGFEEVKPAVDAVRLIYELSVEGLGIRRITSELLERGVKPFGKTGKWTMAYVKKILTWPAVYGECQRYVLENKLRVPFGDPIPNYYPAIMSETDFFAAQAVMGKRKKRGGRKANDEQNLFTGMVHHALDKKTMVLHRPTGNESKYIYLMSGAYLNGEKSNGVSRFPYLPFERAVLDAVCELRPADVADQDRRGNRRSVEAEIERVSRELSATEQKLERTNKRAREAGDIEPFLDLIQSLTKDKKDQKAELERLNIQAAVSQAEALEETQSLVALMATKKGEELERLRRRVKTRLQALVKEMWVLIERRGQRRAAQVQMLLASGKMRELVVHHPRAKPTDEPFLLTDLTGVDLRNYTAEATAGCTST